MFCENCTQDAKLVCSVCKVTRYCSAECQLEDWKTHKKGCKMNQLLKKINQEYHERQRSSKPDPDRCTGCNLKFPDEEEEENCCADECAECGYLVCEDCSVDTSRGTCYCEKKNFSNLYCKMSPRWYHSNGRGVSYKGDRHPEQGGEHPPEAFEVEPRPCGNCGEAAFMLKK
ncbi:hypothetical protein BDY19DRAFT_984056 [Irpex rosettiformis]|uniref:Uncharacterized protein n=1 Tax=Irpex rosettiformis TaxID=378272 RepID=A0ACB8U9S7_9APHY|nr:hypothetical protein BDY19DRAFT_984056 [Irpex rosettiformis]